MAALLVKIIANVKNAKISWEDLSPDLKSKISTKLHNDAMSVAGYEKAYKEQELPKAEKSFIDF